jgi:hypothetical protein
MKAVKTVEKHPCFYDPGRSAGCGHHDSDAVPDLRAYQHQFKDNDRNIPIPAVFPAR